MGAEKGKSLERKSKARQDDAYSKVPFGESRFVRIELTEAEKKQFRELRAMGEYDSVDIDDWLDAGYKLSLTKGDRGSTVIATLTGQYRNMPNAGLVLSGRGSTAPDALAVLSFKDSVLAGTDGWSACEAGRGGSYDDIG